MDNEWFIMGHNCAMSAIIVRSAVGLHDGYVSEFSADELATAKLAAKEPWNVRSYKWADVSRIKTDWASTEGKRRERS